MGDDAEQVERVNVGWIDLENLPIDVGRFGELAALMMRHRDLQRFGDGRQRNRSRSARLSRSVLQFGVIGAADAATPVIAPPADYNGRMAHWEESQTAGAVPTLPLSLAAVDADRHSRILEAGRIQRAAVVRTMPAVACTVRESEGEAQQANTQSLVEWLVAEGTLSRYQASVLAAGHGRRWLSAGW